MDLLDSFANMSDTISIPSDIKSTAFLDSNKIMDMPFEKESMINNLNDMQYSIKIKPLSYVDERKFYTCIDASYKIYEQLRAQKKPISKTFAWCVANIAMFNWFLKSLLGEVLTGREVERAVDFALRSPLYFMIKNCFGGVLQAISIGLSGYGLSKVSGIDQAQYQIIGFYIIAVIINLIKTSIKIYKRETIELQAIKPTA